MSLVHCVTLDLDSFCVCYVVVNVIFTWLSKKKAANNIQLTMHFDPNKKSVLVVFVVHSCVNFAKNSNDRESATVSGN